MVLDFFGFKVASLLQTSLWLIKVKKNNSNIIATLVI